MNFVRTAHATLAPGGGKRIKSVQQQTLDRNHSQSHWETGDVKVDANGNMKMNDYGRPRLTNNKSKVYYDD